MRLEVCSILLTLLLSITDSIILLDLQIPPFVREGDTVKLVCVYDLEYDGLYSVKWYKNDIEFYSYIPKMSPSEDGQGSSKKRFFDLPGVYINKEESDARQVVLSNVSVLASEGDYKCQVSGEAPRFAIEAQTKRLRVAIVPKGPPVIANIDQVFFKLGDWLNLNCTSKPSRPPTRLTWLVNGVEASDRMIRRFTTSPRIEDMKQMAAIDKTELTQVVLGLQFWVTSEHFQSNSKLKVKCRGRIPSVYQAESDTLIVGEHDGPQHKVLQATSGATSSATVSNKGMKGFLLLLQLLFPFSEKQIKLPSTKTDETLWAAGQKEAKWTILKMLIFLLFLLSFKDSCCRL